MQTYKLRGKVSPGMFPNEVVVVVRDHHDHEQALIVRKELVTSSGVDGTIDVQLVDQGEGFSLIRLPGELVTTGRVLSVKDSQLE